MVRKQALIVKLGQIGDAIMAVPAVFALQEQGYGINWVCGRAVAPLLACYSWINPVLVDDRVLFQGRSSQRLRSVLALWRQIMWTQYDLCVVFYYDQRYRVLTLPVRSRKKLMLNRGSRATTLLAGRHQTDEYRRILLQEEDSCRDWSSQPFRPDRLPSSPLQRKKGAYRIAIVPGGVSSLVREQVLGRLPDQLLRRWPVERYVLLTRLLLERGWEVVLLGGPDDAWVRPYFDGLAFTDCIGTLTLPQVVSACDACDAVITHDTGPLHLAGLSTTCLVGIFGPTDPSTRLPRRSYVVGIWGGQGFACRPCYDGRNFAPCTFNGCMHQVAPELVLRELDQVLNDRAAKNERPWRVVCPEGPGVTSPVHIK